MEDFTKDFELYKKLVESFQPEMILQLGNNSRKGNRNGWLSLQPMQLVIEIYYHTGKLQQAVKDNNEQLIKEYSADIANLSMMVVDNIYNLFPLTESDKVKMTFPNNEWTEKIVK